METFILTFLALVLYFLAYQSPKTDRFLYLYSGILFVIASIFGFTGGQDIQVGEEISYNYTTVGNQTVIDTETRTAIYSESTYFVRLFPLFEFWLGLYMILMFVLEGRQDGNRREEE